MNQLIVTGNHSHSTTEHRKDRKLATAPIDLFVELRLCRDGERGSSRSFSRSLQPTVGHYSPVVFPPSGKFVMLGHTEDVGILIRPDLAVTRNCGDLADREESKVQVRFPSTHAILGVGPILKNFHPLLVDHHIDSLVNLQAEFCSHHLW